MAYFPNIRRSSVRKTLVSTAGSNRWSGYSDKNRKFGNSGFWMNMDDDIEPTRFTGSKVDVVKMAGYLRAISNFVKIVTNSEDVKVQFASKDSSYTDGQTVVISSKLDEKGFDSTVGLALHEGSHVLLTDFKWSKELFKELAQLNPDYFMKKWGTVNNLHSYANNELACKHIGILKDLLNVVEDRRIDSYIYKSAPGYRGYYEALYNRYFNSKEVDRVLSDDLKVDRTIDSYMFHVINITNPNRNLNALPGLQKIWDTLSLSKIDRLKSTQQAFDVACDIFGIIIDNLEAAAQKKEEDEKDGNGNGQGNGQSDPGNGQGQGSGETPEITEDTEFELGEGEGNPIQRELTPKEQAIVNKAMDRLKEQKQFMDGNIKKSKMSGKDRGRINAAVESNIKYKSVGNTDVDTEHGGKTFIKGTNCVVLHGWSEKVIQSGLLSGFINPGYIENAPWYQKDRYKDAIAHYLANQEAT